MDLTSPNASKEEPSTEPLVERRENPSVDSAVKLSDKTPMFEAIHAARYHRQELIRSIQDAEPGTKLLCYVCGLKSSVHRDDIVLFVDLVHHVDKGSNIDLILHTGGGDIDAAEKLVSVLRNRVSPKGRFRVIVPDFAKSAGTLMAIGADSIIMSDTSELGPLDPQIALADANGNRVAHSVNNFLDAYQQHSNALRQDPTDPVARMMLDKMDPGTIKLFESVRERSRGLAEQLLKTGMLQEKGNFTAAATKLINTEIWRTHGQVIDWSAAEDMKLNVLYLTPSDEKWKRYWRLYCLQRLSLGSDAEKLYESELVSLTAS